MLPWSVDPRMAQASRMVLFFSLGALFKGEPDYMQLVEPDVLLEKNAEGAANWHFDGDGTPCGRRSPRSTSIAASFRYRDPALRADFRVSLQTQATEGEPSSLRFSGRGKLRGEAFEMEGRSQGLVALRRAGRSISARPATRVPAGRWSISTVRSFRAIRRTCEGRCSCAVPICRCSIRSFRPRSRGRPRTASRASSRTPRDCGCSGASRVSSGIAIFRATSRSTCRPRAPRRLPISCRRDSITRISADSSGCRRASRFRIRRRPSSSRRHAARAASPRVLPEKPLDIAKLREYDADVRFRGTSVKWGDVPMDNLVAHLTLQDGVLHFDPLDFGIADGHVVSNVVMDVNPRPAQAQGEIQARNVELKRIFPRLASPQRIRGSYRRTRAFPNRGQQRR